MTLPIDLDEIAARKQLAAERRRSSIRDRRDAQRSAQELETDRRRELEEADRAAARALGLIAAMEREAQRIIAAKLGGANALAEAARILARPGIRTVRGLDGQRPQKETSRPAGVDGRVSFHFAVTSESRQGRLIAVLKGNKSAAAALAASAVHQRYIERPEAAERVPATRMQAYIEDSSKAERSLDGELETSSFGNIADTAAEREEFWRHIENSERQPHEPRVLLNPAQAPEVWDKLRELAANAVDVPGSLAAVLANNAAVDKSISEDEAIRLVQLFQRAGLARIAFAEKAEHLEVAPISFVIGRGGRVQTRLVIELPHELSAGQRLALAREFCASYDRKGLPHWAVVHAPNEHNDSRNFHMHINLYDRPGDRVSDPTTGRTSWNFDVLVRRKDKRGAIVWVPRQRNKAREVAQVGWIKTERSRFVELANTYLAAANQSKRLHAGTYKELGIDKAPRSRLTPAAYARERKGLVTEAGLVLAGEQWSHNRQNVAAIAGCDAAFEVYRQNQLAKLAVQRPGIIRPDSLLIRHASDAIARLSGEKVRLETERNALLHVGALVGSRARLRPSNQRDATDEAALATAAEFHSRASEIASSIEAVNAKLSDAKRNLLAAIRRDDAAIAAKQASERPRGIEQVEPGPPASDHRAGVSAAAATSKLQPRRIRSSDLIRVPHAQVSNPSKRLDVEHSSRLAAQTGIPAPQLPPPARDLPSPGQSNPKMHEHQTAAKAGSAPTLAGRLSQQHSATAQHRSSIGGVIPQITAEAGAKRHPTQETLRTKKVETRDGALSRVISEANSDQVPTLSHLRSQPAKSLTMSDGMPKQASNAAGTLHGAPSAQHHSDNRSRPLPLENSGLVRPTSKTDFEIEKWVELATEKYRIIVEEEEIERAKREALKARLDLQNLVASTSELRCNSGLVLLALKPEDVSSPDSDRSKMLLGALPPSQLGRAESRPGRFTIALEALIDWVTQPGQADLIWLRKNEAKQLLADCASRFKGPDAKIWAPRDLSRASGRGVGD